MNARMVAMAALAEWRQGRHFADAIVQRLLADGSLGAADRAFAMELFYGVLRNLTLLDFWIGFLRPNFVDQVSRDILRLGLYQLLCLRTPSHAAVFETVALAGKRNRAFINAVLRAALRRAAELETAAAAEPLATRFSHPAFLITRWSEVHGGEAAAALCAWNNKPAPLYARVSTLRIAVDEFIERYPQSQRVNGKPNFVRVNHVPHEALAGGECYIQDPSTSLACEMLAPQPDQTVLDACAAPGGKTALLAELMHNRGELVACDRDGARLEVLRGNLERLGVSCARVLRRDWTSSHADTGEPDASFDRILLDAPCSNTGVMRRRVDVRWRLTQQDFLRMQCEQLMILRAVVPLLKPGGVLVYSTCSLEAEENEGVVEQALRDFPFLNLDEHSSVLPFRDGFDGAFAAKLTLAG